MENIIKVLRILREKLLNKKFNQVVPVVNSTGGNTVDEKENQVKKQPRRGQVRMGSGSPRKWLKCYSNTRIEVLNQGNSQEKTYTEEENRKLNEKALKEYYQPDYSKIQKVEEQKKDKWARYFASTFSEDDMNSFAAREMDRKQAKEVISSILDEYCSMMNVLKSNKQLQEEYRKMFWSIVKDSFCEEEIKKELNNNSAHQL